MFYNQDDIRDHIASFYEHLYKETDYSRPLLDGIQFSTILNEDAMWLEHTFDENEIVDVVKGFNEDKLRGQMVSLWPFFSSVGALFEVRWWLCIRNSLSIVISKEVSMQLLFLSFLRNMGLMRLKISDLLA